MKDIDEIRRENMRLIEREAGGTTEAATLCGMSPSQFANLRDGAKDSKTGKQRGMRKETARRIEASAKKPEGWLDIDHSGRWSDPMTDFESAVRRYGVEIHRPGNRLEGDVPDWLEVTPPNGDTYRHHPLFTITRHDGKQLFVDFVTAADVGQGIATQLQQLAFEHPDELIVASTAEAISSDFARRIAHLAQGGTPAPAPHEAPSGAPGAPPDLVITEFDTGGGMDTTGRLLLDDQPGTIKSWRVTHEWLRLNVPNHTGVRNLCIVTGFGPSMRPMFNPGDPLLVDTGVKTVTHEGVYFFRVGDEGYIKMIQRVPDPHGDGVMLNIISKNPDYPPYPMSPKNPHFEVLGKVLTVWRSEQY